ncbi:glycoside hydrolase family 3 C-terminal domain-containing protein [Actinoplanes campanulatus]|uniref:glycoside hydrolase family 3 C-terminal domain-containing protein n=1 Tax=Actinoplanes campanulatus TaxID=113559 RepID=UPI0027E48FAC|nr:glycoside hydrolase family 3 C-terminal domain-containing protein [Actinoplanes capillaceus]
MDPGPRTCAEDTASVTTCTRMISSHQVSTWGTHRPDPHPRRCEDFVTPLAAITARAARAGATVTYDNGSDPAAAAVTAAGADIAVVFGHQRAGEFTDLADLRLQGGRDALISAVAAANPRTVVVLQTGSAVEMPWLDQVPAVLQNWYGGEQMGPALAALLFGDVNPSGKLPMTFPRSLADTPTAGDPARYPGVVVDGIRQVSYSEGLQVGYRWYEARGIDPLFAFGYGLSYTSFAYRDLEVTGDGRDGVRIRFRLANTGRRSGTEVAQAYVTLPSVTGEPAKRLAGWSRVTLEPGRSRTVQINLSRSDLAELHLLQYFDATRSDWVTARGTYEFIVGGSSTATLHDTLRVR